MTNMNTNHYFSTMMVGLFSAQIVAVGYLSYFLDSFGYGQAFIGIVTTLSAFSSIFSRFLYGYLMDKYSNPKHLLYICFTFCTVVQILLFFFYHSKLYVLFYALNSLGPVAGICDSWVLKSSKADSNIDYAAIRSAGSVAYSIMSLVAGWVIPILGNHAAILITCVSLFLFLFSISHIPNPVFTVKQEKATISFRDGIHYLLRNKPFMIVMVCVFLYSLTNISYVHYYSLFILELGGTSREVGLGLFIMAFSESLVMRKYTLLADRYGNERLLAASFLFYALRSFLVSCARNTIEVLFFTLTQMISFAFQMPGTMLLISKIVKYEYQSSAVQIMGLVSTVGQLIFGTTIGAIYENYGRISMLRIFAIPSLVAFAVLKTFTNKWDREKSNC